MHTAVFDFSRFLSSQMLFFPLSCLAKRTRGKGNTSSFGFNVALTVTAGTFQALAKLPKKTSTHFSDYSRLFFSYRFCQITEQPCCRTQQLLPDLIGLRRVDVRYAVDGTEPRLLLQDLSDECAVLLRDPCEDESNISLEPHAEAHILLRSFSSSHPRKSFELMLKS